MMAYTVVIEELLKMNVVVEAETPEEAKEIVQQKYEEGEFVLDYNNYVTTDISVTRAKNYRLDNTL
jgi:hypothetical protein